MRSGWESVGSFVRDLVWNWNQSVSTSVFLFVSLPWLCFILLSLSLPTALTVSLKMVSYDCSRGSSLVSETLGEGYQLVLLFVDHVLGCSFDVVGG